VSVWLDLGFRRKQIIYLSYWASILWAIGPKFAGKVGLRGIGYGGQFTVPAPVIPDGEKFSPIYIPMGIIFVPSPSPNRGIPRGESGIGSPLPSLPGTTRLALHGT
jgi:hypothetical protein